MAHPRSGLAAGIGAYLRWGLFPLSWPLLEPAGAIEILAHRIAWSLVFLAAAPAATAVERADAMAGLAPVCVALAVFTAGAMRTARAQRLALAPT